MNGIRLFALGAWLIASPALAADWKVQAVSGDAVTLMPNSEPDPLDEGSAVKDGATVISGPMTSVELSRQGDSVHVNANAIVDFRAGGGGRGVVEAKAGRIEVKSLESDTGTLEIVTKFFRVDAQAAAFSVEVHKDFATVDVLSGQLQVQDIAHGGEPFVLRAGAEFRGVPAKPKEEAKPQKPEAAKNAEADAALKELDALKAKSHGKLSKEDKKKRSALIKKLAEKGITAAGEGLEEMAEDYDGDAPVEVPKVGILSFLFGPNSPGAGYVVAGLVALFLLFGALTSTALGSVAFGVVGNAVILLIGALIGAAIHDFVFSPETFWSYEPTPGIVTTTLAAAATLIGACFLRRYVEDRWEEASTAKAAKASVRAPRRKFG